MPFSLQDSKTYSFDVGTSRKASIKLSNKYDGISQVIGLTAVTEANAVSGNATTSTDGIKNGFLIPLRLNFRKPAGNNSFKHSGANIVVPTDKVDEAVTGLVGKKWGEGTITSCRGQIRMDFK